MTNKFDHSQWKLITRTYPDCHARTKKDNAPTLSPGGFLDQIIYCVCGWCGVDSIGLTAEEEAEFLVRVKPKQLRLL